LYHRLRPPDLQSYPDKFVFRFGQIRFLLAKLVGDAVTDALVAGALRAVKSLSISSRNGVYRSLS
jgi:hypothetical protein